MIATIDGKTVSGSRDEPMMDLGSPVDRAVMKRLENATDAVLVGARTVRSAKPTWKPGINRRIVVSRSGELPWDAAFFSEHATVVTVEGSQFVAPPGVELIRVGVESVELPLLLAILREGGVGSLLVLGGSELNGELLRHDLADELFLTIAPKVKLGTDVPTYAGGEVLTRDNLMKFRLLEHNAVQDEVFLRYRRERNA